MFTVGRRRQRLLHNEDARSAAESWPIMCNIWRFSARIYAIKRCIIAAGELGTAISCNPKATEPRLLRRRGYAQAEFSAAGRCGLKSLVRFQFRFLEQEGSGGLDGRGERPAHQQIAVGQGNYGFKLTLWHGARNAVPRVPRHGRPARIGWAIVQGRHPMGKRAAGSGCVKGTSPRGVRKHVRDQRRRYTAECGEPPTKLITVSIPIPFAIPAPATAG